MLQGLVAVIWSCKSCKETVSSRSELLHHYKLKHPHFGRSSRFPCTYLNCPCTFKTWNALNSVWNLNPLCLFCACYYLDQRWDQENHHHPTSRLFQRRGGHQGQNLTRCTNGRCKLYGSPTFIKKELTVFGKYYYFFELLTYYATLYNVLVAK